MAHISFPARLRKLADEAPDRIAVTCGDQQVTRAQLEARADTLARHLRDLGVAEGDLVTMALPNSVDWYVTAIALWKLGATPQPVSYRLPPRELEAIIELADPPIVIGTADTPASSRRLFDVAEWLAASPALSTDVDSLPDKVSPAWKAPTSGGSTGRPKLIVSGDPALIDEDGAAPLLMQRDGCMVMPGPLYHNAPVVWTCQALLWGNHVVLLPRFDAAETLQALATHGADVVYLVPTMMKRIWRLPIEEREAYDLSHLRVVWHLAEPCPMWLKDAWIEWLGPDRMWSCTPVPRRRWRRSSPGASGSSTAARSARCPRGR